MENNVLTEKEIQDSLSLESLFKEANESLVNDYRREGVNKIKSLVHAANELRHEIRQGELTVEKKKKQLDKKLGTLEAIKAGDWSILSRIGKDGAVSEKNSEEESES